MEKFFSQEPHIDLISGIKSKLFGTTEVSLERLETENSVIDDEIDFTNAPNKPGELHNKSFQEEYVDSFINHIKYTWEKEGINLVSKDKIVFTRNYRQSGKQNYCKLPYILLFFQYFQFFSIHTFHLVHFVL